MKHEPDTENAQQQTDKMTNEDEDLKCIEVHGQLDGRTRDR